MVFTFRPPPHFSEAEGLCSVEGRRRECLLEHHSLGSGQQGPRELEDTSEPVPCPVGSDVGSTLPTLLPVSPVRPVLLPGESVPRCVAGLQGHKLGFAFFWRGASEHPLVGLRAAAARRRGVEAERGEACTCGGGVPWEAVSTPGGGPGPIHPGQDPQQKAGTPSQAETSADRGLGSAVFFLGIVRGRSL